jgi:diketogulonate reductase-like aldo/keto reductase
MAPETFDLAGVDPEWAGRYPGFRGHGLPMLGIDAALELGVTHIDTAEVYGPFHSEELVGRAIKAVVPRWVVVAAKFGLISYTGRDPGELDSSPADIRTAIERSLQRLGTDDIDLYYQHRWTPAIPSKRPWPRTWLGVPSCATGPGWHETMARDDPPKNHPESRRG